MVTVSVIIPVYNAAPYLADCVQSLVKQSQPSMEFIFIDDGSTDGSLSILQSYADHRIKVITQQNAGVSVARNRGLALASGAYVGFVDADDYVDQDMFATLYQLASQTKAEVVISSFKKMIDGQEITAVHPFAEGKIYTSEDIYQEVIPTMLQRDVLNSVVVKLFSRSFLCNNKVVFPIGMALGEDAQFTLTAFSKANHIVFTNYIGYYYREVIGSATRNPSEKDYFQAALAVFNFNHAALFERPIAPDALLKWKSVRLFNQVLSFSAVCQRQSTQGSMWQRYSYLASMIKHPVVQKIVRTVPNKDLEIDSSFKRFVFLCIKCRFVLGIWLAYLYSNHRNFKQ